MMQLKFHLVQPSKDLSVVCCGQLAASQLEILSTGQNYYESLVSRLLRPYSRQGVKLRRFLKHHVVI